MTKILFVSPLPPPHYGSAMSSEMCLNILIDNPQLSVKSIKINPSGNMKNVGEFSFKKVLDVVRVWFLVICRCVVFNPKINYVVPATAGFALFRDFSVLVLIKLLSKGKIIIHLRSRFIEEDFNNKIKLFVIKTILDSDKVIILGKELLPNLKGVIGLEKIVCLPNAIPLTFKSHDFKDLVLSKYSNKNIFNILFLSNMNVEKGWVKVLESLIILRNNKKDFVCRFVGAWPSKKEENLFNNFVKINKLEANVIFNGPAYGEDKNKHIKNADVLVFPTMYKMETFGRVIIEAMEYGTPVIANGIATIPSIIDHGVTGFVLKENTPLEISNYIECLMNDNVRKEFGLKSRSLFENKFTLECFKNKFQNIILN